MNKHLLLFTFLLSFSSAFSQTNKNDLKRFRYNSKKVNFAPKILLDEEVIKPQLTPPTRIGNFARPEFTYNANRNDSCGIDTLKYYASKASTIGFYTMNDTTSAGNNYNSGFAQFYEAPQDINIHGACFYAAGLDTNNYVDVTVSLYNADANKLPTTIITQKTISINTLYNASDINSMLQCVSFDSVITLNHSYAIAVNTNTLTNFFVGGNSSTNADGAGEDNGSLFYSDSSFLSFVGWYKMLQFTTPTAFWDFDFLLEPTVSYDYSIELTVNDSLICSGDSICFNLGESAVANNKFHTPIVGSIISTQLGDGNTSTDLNNCHTYNNGGNYTLESNKNLIGWTTSCPSSSSLSLNVMETPTANFSWTHNGNGLVTFTDSSSLGIDVNWDFGDFSGSSTDQDPYYQYSDLSDTNTVTLTVSNMCGTDSTTKDISFKANNYNEKFLNNQIKVFPVPVKDILNINYKGNITLNIEIIDITGKTVFRKNNLTPSNIINTNNLSKGLYYLNFKTNQNTITRKIIVE